MATIKAATHGVAGEGERGRDRERERECVRERERERVCERERERESLSYWKSWVRRSTLIPTSIG